MKHFFLFSLTLVFLAGCAVQEPFYPLHWQIRYNPGQKLSPFRYNDKAYKTVEKLALDSGLDLCPRTAEDRKEHVFRFEGKRGKWRYAYQKMLLVTDSDPALNPEIQQAFDRAKILVTIRVPGSK